jgi:hypothetical protein
MDSYSGGPTGRVRIPSVLAVGCPLGLPTRIHDAAVAAGALTRLCGVVTYARQVAKYLPQVVIMTEELYEFDPRHFAWVAQEHGARLVTVPEDITIEDLHAILSIELQRANESTAASASESDRPAAAG